MKSIIFVSTAIFVLSGCTGINHTVTPSPTNFTITQPYSSIGIRPLQSDTYLVSAGVMSEEFSTALKDNRVAKDIYYPMRADDKPEIVIDTKFNSSLDAHSGSHFAQGFFTGLTFFLIEPFLWYSFDYSFTGEAKVFKDDKLVKTIAAKTDAVIEAKWLSLSDVKKEQDLLFPEVKKSLLSQMINELGK